MLTRYTYARNSYDIYFYPTEKEDSVGKKSFLNGPAIILLPLLLHERGKQDEKEKRRRKKHAFN